MKSLFQILILLFPLTTFSTTEHQHKSNLEPIVPQPNTHFIPTVNLNHNSDTTYSWQSQLELDIGIAVGFPLETFQRNLEQDLIGFNASALVRIHHWPSLFLGLDMTHFGFARVRADYFLDYDGFLEEFDVRTQTNLLGIHGKIRIAPPGYRKWLPYLEGMIGTKFFGTRTRVYELIDGEYERFDGYLQNSDWVLSYGGAVGLIRTLASRDEVDISAHLRIGFYPGAGATYLVTQDNYDLGLQPEDPYIEKFSTTNLWLVQIGVTFAFGEEILEIR